MSVPPWEGIVSVWTVGTCTLSGQEWPRAGTFIWGIGMAPDTRCPWLAPIESASSEMQSEKVEESIQGW